MPLIKGSAPEVIRENIAELRRAGRDEKQAVAIAYRMARESAERVDDAMAPKTDAGGEAEDATDRVSMK